jgi:beta-glucosidase
MLTYLQNNMEYHLIPFKAAIAAGARQMMPYYSRPIGTKYEEVASGFNRGIITDLLKHELGFKGIVVSDWGLITDAIIAGQDMPARAWGAENLTEIERVEKILNAGVDQFGGETRTDLILEVVKKGIVSEERIDESVGKLMKEKFLLGLFDNPFVDAEASERIVGQEYFVRKGQEAQRKAYTMLTNSDNVLPLKAAEDMKFYIEGFNATYMANRNLRVVNTTAEADMALIRLQAPYEPRYGGFESRYVSAKN